MTTFGDAVVLLVSACNVLLAKKQYSNAVSAKVSFVIGWWYWNM